jgi:hypothetical protein
MKQELRGWFKSFVLELLVYAVLVTGYYFLVLDFLGNSLKELYEQERRFYAVLALGLIIGQGLLLEILTRLLLAWVKPRTED